ncbi:MAG TPA: tetratricopeptide repeat protein [Fimbriimonas sp.]
MNYANIEGLMQRGMWEDAIVECKAVLQVQPTNPRLHGYMGICHYRLDRWEEAAISLRRAIILDPHFLDAGVKLAQCLDKCGRHLEAFDVCQDFLHLQPGNTTLKGLSEALQRHTDERRIDGWEPSTRLNTVFVEHMTD